MPDLDKEAQAAIELARWCVEHEHGMEPEDIAGVLHAYDQLAAQTSNAHADALVKQTLLKGMSVEEGAAVVDLIPPRELVIQWVHAAREMLGEAPNYSETRIDFPGVSMEIGAAGEERYILTVQRAGKVTPHEARRAAEAERDEAAAAVRDLVAHNDLDMSTPEHARACRVLAGGEARRG